MTAPFQSARSPIKLMVILLLIWMSGLMLAFFTESTLRQFIQTLYRLSTHNRIHLVGKNVHFFSSSFYYVGFGFALVTYGLSVMQKPIHQKWMNAGWLAILFFLALVLISSVYSHLALIGCTACNDGTLTMPYNQINYEGIVLTSLLIGMLPSGGRIIGRFRKQPQPKPSGKLER